MAIYQHQAWLLIYNNESVEDQGYVICCVCLKSGYNSYATLNQYDFKMMRVFFVCFVLFRFFFFFSFFFFFVTSRCLSTTPSVYDLVQGHAVYCFATIMVSPGTTS